MTSILIIDCFDSFTFNIAHYLEQLNVDNVTVARYDELSGISLNNFTHLVLSPGPGLPKDYPLISDLLNSENKFQGILGVCLGLQILVENAGGKLIRLRNVLHGVSSTLEIKPPSVLFNGISESISIAHYHSWVASKDGFPLDKFHISSLDADGNIMSIENNEKSIYGVQFHPESVMTTYGMKIFENWILASKSS